MNRRRSFVTAFIWIFAVIYASYVYSNPVAVLALPLEFARRVVLNSHLIEFEKLRLLLHQISLLVLILELSFIAILVICALRTTKRRVVICNFYVSVVAFVSLLYFHLFVSLSFPEELNPWVPGWFFFSGVLIAAIFLAVSAIQAWKAKHLGRPSLILFMVLIPVLVIAGWLSKDPIPLSYDWVKFKEGLKPASTDGLYGYINESWEWVIYPRFTDAEPFSEGLAGVSLVDWELRPGESPSVCIDKTGRVVLRSPPEYVIYSGFHEGLAIARVMDESGKFRYGYIDKNGNWIIQPQFGEVSLFSEGLAAVSLDSASYDPRTRPRFGYINKTGIFIVPPHFDIARSFREGRALVRPSKEFVDPKAAGMYGFIDEKGNYVISPRFEEAGSFQEGLAPFRSRGKEGFIDPNGKIVIPPVFDQCDNFSDGVARVWVGEKKGYIDKAGKMVILDKFSRTEDFERGRALVCYPNGHSVYIDKLGHPNRRPLREVLVSWRAKVKQIGWKYRVKFYY